MTTRSLQSIAIAGAWGYIGQKFTEAGLDLGLDVYVFDPGPPPEDLTSSRLHRVEHEVEFYELDTDLYHLALHPQHRSTALSRLLPRAGIEDILILNEKPMAQPETPSEPLRLLREIGASGATVLFDFPELFDPLTHRLMEFLLAFDEVRLDEIHIQRSKDREAKDNPRNRKQMVHIQYQESVHCLAFVLNLLSQVGGGTARALEDGFTVEAASEPYDAPNPEVYSYVVDGRCDYTMTVGQTKIHGHTNFKRHAPWRKQRLIRGVGDGVPFEIDVDYLEGEKYLRIGGRDLDVDPADSSYEAVLLTLQKWRKERSPVDLMAGIYPNPSFAFLTYQLSGALWKASRKGSQLHFDTDADLRAFHPGFEDAVEAFPTYT
ncbi:MAG: hypothetical protein CME26_07395 [Gemmatimonadetes bacterium]|mgnify:CR=1 FL=1|nr:hypothetical protein [Gemmatimonadota bacterium]